MIELNISTGNRKMGAIPSFSLPSGKTCSREACATCYKDDCYSAAMERRLPNVRKSYADNLKMLKTDLDSCRRWLDWYFLSPNAPRMFRIHVGGDFFSQEYWWMWLLVAKRHPQTQFMAFTKQFDVVKADIMMGRVPQNMIVIASAWPGAELPEWVHGLMPIAYMQDGTENRVPENAHHCDGDCAGACSGHCWSMKPGDTVVFDKHGPGIKKVRK